MTLVATALLPSAAFLLPTLGVGVPADLVDAVAAQRERVAEVVARLERCADLVVLLVPGDGELVAPTTLTLLPFGARRDAAVDLVVPADLGAAVGLSERAPDAIGAEAHVLAHQLANLRLTVITIDELTGWEQAAELGESVASWAETVDERVAIVGSGDLCAGHDAKSPGALIPAAAAIDAALVTAVRTGVAPPVDVVNCCAPRFRPGLPAIAAVTAAGIAGGVGEPDVLESAVVKGVGQLVSVAGGRW